MVEVYRIGANRYVIRSQGATERGELAQVHLLTKTGAERRSSYRADVVRELGQRVEAHNPEPRYRDNGARLPQRDRIA